MFDFTNQEEKAKDILSGLALMKAKAERYDEIKHLVKRIKTTGLEVANNNKEKRVFEFTFKIYPDALLKLKAQLDCCDIEIKMFEEVEASLNGNAKDV